MILHQGLTPGELYRLTLGEILGGGDIRGRIVLGRRSLSFEECLPRSVVVIAVLNRWGGLGQGVLRHRSHSLPLQR